MCAELEELPAAEVEGEVDVRFVEFPLTRLSEIVTVAWKAAKMPPPSAKRPFGSLA